MIHEFENCSYQMDFDEFLKDCDKPHLFSFENIKEKEMIGTYLTM